MPTKSKSQALKARCASIITADRIEVYSMPPAPNKDDWYRKEKSRLEQEKENIYDQ